MHSSVAEFYTAQSRRFGPSGVLGHHRERADRLDRAMQGRRSARVLELGAGAGGTATATAELGYDVTGVELSPLRAEYARELAATVSPRPRIIEGDFYVAELGTAYDAVVYWNGFGMNEDADQRRLLCRVAEEWLAPGGVMLLDVFGPAWWARNPTDVRTHEEYRACQQTVFDGVRARYVDRWWPVGAEQEAVEQSIRCYAPVDLELLLEGTGMQIGSIDSDPAEPGGDEYSYRVVLRRSEDTRAG